MLVLFVVLFNVQVLSVLVRAITENIADASGDPASCLRPKLLELFGHITAKVTNSADIWRLYAELLASSDSLTDVLHERVSINFLCIFSCSFVKCYRILDILRSTLCLCLTGHFLITG